MARPRFGFKVWLISDSTVPSGLPFEQCLVHPSIHLPEATIPSHGTEVQSCHSPLDSFCTKPIPPKSAKSANGWHNCCQSQRPVVEKRQPIITQPRRTHTWPRGDWWTCFLIRQAASSQRAFSSFQASASIRGLAICIGGIAQHQSRPWPTAQYHNSQTQTFFGLHLRPSTARDEPEQPEETDPAHLVPRPAVTRVCVCVCACICPLRSAFCVLRSAFLSFLFFPSGRVVLTRLD
jgi:hypothetical protein